jgi:hypothetical protein
MILSQNIYGYGSWVVISIVLFDISKNDPFLVPYILKTIIARSEQLIQKWELDLYRIWWNKPHQNLISNINLPYIYQDDKMAQGSLPFILHNNSSKNVGFEWSFTCCKLTASLAMYFRYYVNHVKVCTSSPVYSYISERL